MSITVGPSSIHGLGVFATRRFRRDERIGRYLSRRTQRDGRYVLWLHDGKRWNGYRGIGRLRYVNHSTRPNAEFRGLYLHAIAPIAPGHEITIHYGDDWNDAT